MIQELTQMLPYLLGGLGVLIAAVAAGLFVMVRNSRKENAAQVLSAAMKQKSALEGQFDQYKAGLGGQARAATQGTEPAISALDQKFGVWDRVKSVFGVYSGSLSRSFREAIAVLRRRIPGRDFRYRVPWFMMIGEAGAGKTTLLDNVGLPQPFGSVGGDPFVLRKPVNWWLFTNGVVLDVDGSMIASHDGRTSDEATWHSFLKLLRRSRPERPIDGVVIAIPVDDLTGPKKLSHEDLRRKADLLYDKIWSAQKATGMTFPVYVFVTLCDHIAGFRSYVSELPKHLREDIFGWSNPYSVHAAYVSEWVDEAFANLNSTIYKTQIEIFAESEIVEDSDGVFLFPAEFQSLIEPLRVYLNHLFKESAHHESFMFRGLYFSGDAELDAPVTTEIGSEYKPLAAAAKPSPVFLKHVFEKKIFPEYRLARPVFRSVLARNRWALAGQIACLVFLVGGILGLALSRNSLRGEVAAFTPVLVEVEKDLTQIRDLDQSATAPLTAGEMLQRLEGVDPVNVLADMQTINAATLKSVFLPASWWSDLDDRLDRALNVTFSRIVLGALYLTLSQRIQQAFEIEAPAPSETAFRVVTPASMPEFQALRQFVDRVKELEEYVNLYNFEATPGSGDLPTLGKLVKYIYGTELPPQFYENSDFYLRALKSSQQDIINIQRLKTDVGNKQDALAQEYFDALVDRQLPIALLNELQAELDLLAREPTTLDSDANAYRAMMVTIDQLNQVFSRPELAWLGASTFSPGPEFTQLLDDMSSSMLFGADARKKMQDMATVTFNTIRSTLENYQSPLTGPVLQVTDNTLKPSMPLLALRKGLEDFLNQRFMATSTGRRIRATPPQGFHFTWDVTGLQQALQLVEPYNAFIVGGLTSFRPELQSRLRLMALNRLEANMVSIVSAAQRTDTAIAPQNGSLELDVQNDTKQLTDAAKPIGELLSAFDRLAMTRAYGDLSDAALSSALHHLRTVEQLFVQTAPYSYDIAGLARWDGTEPLATAVFAVKDDKEFPQYLDAQRENLKRLKDYTNPALMIINGLRSARRTTADAQLIAKWQAISAELTKYDSKNPASSVAALESFISTTLPALNTENYFERITPQDLAAQSSDFFLSRRNELRRQVYERFDNVASARILRQYRELETHFNQRLAGRFPFDTSLFAPTTADPVSIREFFKLFDTYSKGIVSYLERKPKNVAAPPRVLQFITDMAAVRNLFAPFLADPKALALIFDFEVEFRVNRRAETGANQIIEWQLEVGEQKITARDAMKRGRWILGDPVRLSLRWAKDGNIVPVPERVDGVIYEDRKVMFEDMTRWSIFRFLRMRAAEPADFDQLVDPMPHTLKFIVPTMVVGDGAMQTRVFVRLTLLSADKKEPITIPAFPDRAPSMDRT